MTGGQIEGETGLCAKASAPAPLGLTSDCERRHVAIEHDVYAWEAWLILRWLVNSTPDGTLAHGLNCRPGLTPKLTKILSYIIYMSNIYYFVCLFVWKGAPLQKRVWAGSSL